MDEFGIVLHLTPSDGRPRVATFTFAGQLGYMGMNHLGVSHFANAMPRYLCCTVICTLTIYI